MQSKRILVCPLNWGLGHATRCIPIIQALRADGYTPVIATSGRALYLLREEFPELEFIELPDYQITYQKNGSFALNLVKLVPSVMAKIRQEHKVLQRIIDEQDIHGVISDNRFGLHTHKVPTAFVSNQIRILAPMGQWFVSQVNQSFVKRFDECWIPDFEDENNLCGYLTQGFSSSIKAKYLGPLSRFTQMAEKKEHTYRILALISGPEPQRSYFEKIVRNQLIDSGIKAVMVRGVPEEEKMTTHEGNTTIHSYCTANELLDLIYDSELVISRSGYSTVSDLTAIGKKAVFCPTPGQTEQEFLARRLDEKGFVPMYEQSEFNLEEARIKAEDYSGLPFLDTSHRNWSELFKLFEG
ncbi:glycosyltransferase [Cryomorphaceae bacterium]|nr:glycosyltransferase [Cryomorphaceae bacterium]